MSIKQSLLAELMPFLVVISVFAVCVVVSGALANHGHTTAAVRLISFAFAEFFLGAIIFMEEAP